VNTRIYLDHNAGAPLRPAARAAVVEVLDGPPANPSSAHREGARARRIVDEARAAVAALIGADPAEIVFTSGATEANNLALRGGGAQALPARGEPPAIVTTAVEHASVLETAQQLGARLVPVDGEGYVAPASLAAACTPNTRLVSVGLANGEVGTVQPLAAVAAALSRRGIVLHTDAAQAAGRLPIDVHELGVDLLSLSSLKLGGPAGVGALWVRRGVPVAPLLTGGPQERGRRAGTENVAAIAGFGAAARAARAELDKAPVRMAALVARLWEAIAAVAPDAVRHGPTQGPCLPNTLNVRIPGCRGESLLVLLDMAGIAVSLGSACAAASSEPSHVLLAMGLDRVCARDAVRFSIGPDTTPADIDAAAGVLTSLVARLRRGDDLGAPIALAEGGRAPESRRGLVG